MSLRNLPVDERPLLIRDQLAAEIPAVSELVAFLRRLGDRLGMRVVSDPLALEADLPADMGHGVHVHLNWAESGTDIYSGEKFGYPSLSVHTCRPFDDWGVIREFVDSFPVVEYELGWAA